ncbi:hypothetical protein F2Q69_00053062 [Brassica cretica]|uniref:TLDc domain-containing protein n=1 Tax=Brassica cretica TaxID=69181 RepID=A0A8S9MZX4_BRACR|nr:hypothetical protein F2Q69_00053062 [Brassica cretica]
MNENENEKVNENENENENKNVSVSMNLFEVLFGPPRTGGRLESRLCKPWGSSSTLGTYGSCGVVSNGAPTGTWGSGLARATHGGMIRCARLDSSSGKTFSSYFPFGVRQSGNENEEEESESCPPKHGNGKHQAATMISSGQDKDSELHVSAKVESDYNEGVKQIAELTESSAFISADLFEFLHSCLPNIVRGCKWILLYSTLKHGISLRTLLRRSADLPGPCLLVAGDKQGAVFGAMLECPLRTTPKRKYQACANRYYYMCMNELLAFGGGGSFALCLDEDLLKATSGPSETFGNECLASSTEFELKNVELWGFAHASQYLFS